MGKYKFDQPIGKGSYGTVFKSQVVSKGKRVDVAVKRFDRHDEIFGENALDELEILLKLTDHDNIIKLVEFSKDDDFIYLVTELADLGDLRKFLTSAVPGLDVKLQIMENSVGGLAFLHNKTPPIVHRDIKLENILISRQVSGRIVAKLCDFGLSSLFHLDTDEFLKSTNAGRGTLEYLAPELQVHGRKQYDKSVDVFAMGLVFMQLLDYTEDYKSLEPYPVSLNTGDILSYGQVLRTYKKENRPPPPLFTLTCEDKWPVTELKALITAMTAYEARHRVTSREVLSCIKFIKEGLKNPALKYSTQEQVMELQSSLEDVRLEQVVLESALSEAKIQIKKSETILVDKDHVIINQNMFITEMKKTITEKDKIVKAKDQVIQDQGEEIQNSLKVIEAKKQIIYGTNIKIKDKTQQVSNLQAKLAHEKQRASDIMYMKVTEAKKQIIYDTNIKIKDKTQQVSNLQAKLAHEKQQASYIMKDKEQLLQDKDKTIAILQTKLDNEKQLAIRFGSYFYITVAVILGLVFTPVMFSLTTGDVWLVTEIKTVIADNFLGDILTHSTREQLLSMREQNKEAKQQLKTQETSMAEKDQTISAYREDMVGIQQELKEKDQLIKQMKKLEIEKLHSFRKYSDLQSLQSSKFVQIKKFETCNFYRLCYFNNHVYVPCRDENSIRVYTAEGELTRTLQLANISAPRALHPISPQHLVLAAETGLYVIDDDGHVIEALRSEGYSYVHADDKYIVGKVWGSKQITVLDVTPPYNTHAQFSHSYIRSVLVSGDRVYITDFDTDQVIVYTTRGERVGSYGRGGQEHTEPGRLSWPHLSVSDANRSILVADWGHDRLQVMSAAGEWTVLNGLQVRRPHDVVIVGDKMYVLDKSGKRLVILKNHLIVN